MVRVSKFQKGSGTYKCSWCGKQTRETGDGESSVEMCSLCYEIAGVENMHSDDGHEGMMYECSECVDQLSADAKAYIPTHYKKEGKIVPMGDVFASVQDPSEYAQEQEAIAEFDGVAAISTLLEQGIKIKHLVKTNAELVKTLEKVTKYMTLLYNNTPYGQSPIAVGMVETMAARANELIQNSRKED